jgi:DMSO/TMAO reductase YedYZ molybdopterin-dependent catalytic subunit
VKGAILVEDADLSRRTLLKGGSAVLAGLSVLQIAGPAHALVSQVSTGDDLAQGDGASIGPSGDVLPWLDQPADIPPPAQDIVGNLLKWEDLDSYRTPNAKFFTVKHYELPSIDASAWRLGIDGLVNRPMSVSLADLQRRSRRTVDFTLECSGNTGLPFVIGAVGNARWTGTPLAPLLRQAGITNDATEVVFWGTDSGTVTIRDDSGITGGGTTGTVADDGSGGLDLTITEHFARSMSVADAMSDENLLCYEMNGDPLPPEHGFPVRLIAPGWYGVANVKWLDRIEVRNQRYTGRFMARDYVSIREEILPNGEVSWTFSNVGHARLKSAPAKVVRHDGIHTVVGVAWGAPIAAVQVSIDGGDFKPAELIGPTPSNRGVAWRFWKYEWGKPAPGEHTVTSRALDASGDLQPAADDPFLVAKHTYWESNGQITRRVLIA